MSELQKSMLKSKLPPRAPSSSGKLAPFGASRQRDYTPASWKLYFDRALDIETDSGSFRVYLTKEPEHLDQLRILTLHGGGYSGLSWALFTHEVTKLIECQVVSMDIRGHGETKAGNPNDLSAETLANDVQAVVSRLWGMVAPPLLLIGHSMGGAVAVHAAHHPLLVNYVQGLAVIDVVEGTAMESLASMQSFLRGRPTHFKSIEHAIEWCVRSGQVRNVESARVSMPSQIVNCETDLLATHEVEGYMPVEEASVSRRDPLPSHDVIMEEPDSQEDVCFKEPTTSSAEVTDMRLAPFGASRQRDYTPASWKLYFDRALDIETDSGSFRVYLTKEPEHLDQLRILTLHGGGYSGLSWALFTHEVTKLIECQVVSMDIRGHGETKAGNPNDLSAETLANDVQAVVSRLWGMVAPPLLLIGHSMGGAVAVHAAHHPLLVNYVQGLAVIDVVEGTAMESLASMQSFLRGRPTHFKSIEHAIEWCVRSGQVRNVESARVSMPSQIVNCETDLLATHEVEGYMPVEEASVSRRDPLPSHDVIMEEPDSQEDVCFKEPTTSSAEVTDMR